MVSSSKSSSLLLFVSLALLFVCCSGASVEVIANCTADATSALSNARNRVRSMQPLSTDVTVLVIGVCREALQLDATLDSGVLSNESLPLFSITYRGPTQAANPPAVLHGGVDIPFSQLSVVPSSSRIPFPFPNRVYQANLTELYGLTQANFGNYTNGGLGECGHNAAQLYVQDTPMINARTPNAHGMVPPTTSQVPWTSWFYPLIIPPNTSNTFISNGTSNYSAIAAAFLNSELVAENNNVWAHGYWAWDWADNFVRIANIRKLSPDDVALSAPYEVSIDPSTPPIYDLKAGNGAGRFYLINHPVFLDAPGEYYIDQTRGMLYVIPPVMTGDDADMDALVFTLSIQASPLIEQVNNTDVALTNVNFENLALTYGRTSAVQLFNANYVRVDHVSLFGFTQGGIDVTGTNIVVNFCAVSQLGCSGVGVTGGDCRTLAPGSNTISNNQITNFARLTRSYSRGVYVGGVGAQVTNNFIFNAPHQGISASGNDHAFSLNTLFNLCYGTIDAGAFYIGRSWINRGMTLSQNVFENIFIQEPVTHTSTMVSAIYWDDQQSGVTASMNRMRNVDNCFLLGGGRDNTIVDNVCINSANFMVYFDNRGMNWQRDMCTPPGGLLVEQLFSVNYTNPPFSTAYPRIVSTLSDEPCVPVGNVISGNSFSALARGFCSQDNATITAWKSEAFNNTAL